jgi:hypothetical protein
MMSSFNKVLLRVTFLLFRQVSHFYCYAGCYYTKCQYADCCIHVRNITKIQLNNIQQIDIQHLVMLRVTILLFRQVSHFYCYAECHYTKCHYADCCSDIRNLTNIQHSNIQNNNIQHNNIQHKKHPA